MCLPGGWLADRLLGAQRAVFWGALLITIGNALLAVPADPTVFYLGCIVVVIGVGLLKPNISAMVAQLYPEGGARRDAGFTLFYFGINVGALIGALVNPWLAVKYGWRAGFAAASATMALGLWQFLASRHHLGDAGKRRAPTTAVEIAADRQRWRWVATIAGLLLVLVTLITAGAIPFDPGAIAKLTAAALLVVATAYFMYLLFMAGLDTLERKRVLVVLALFVASAIFWAGYEQAGSSMNLFAERFTDRMAIGFEIPRAGSRPRVRSTSCCSRQCFRRCGSSSVNATSILPRQRNSHSDCCCSAWGSS